MASGREQREAILVLGDLNSPEWKDFDMTSTDWTGKDVLSADNERLGRVKEVQGGYFQIDAPHAKDYWLSAMYADASSAAVELRLTLPANEVADHKLDKPGLEPIGADAGRRGDVLLSDAQALLQRERMEHELAAQNRHAN